jgi:hypothetical protein
MIVLTVSPSGYSNRGALFDGTVDGWSIVTRSSQPMFDGARSLLANGADPAAKLVMRHAGSDADALRSTVGAAARLTVEEGERRPKVTIWKPRFPTAANSPMRQNQEEATW